MPTTITPNMGLTLPVVGVEPGPQFATDINSSFSTVDQHNHALGNGVPINSNGLNLTQDLSLNGVNLTTTRSVRFVNLTATSTSDVGSIYVLNNQPYYNDFTGTQFRLATSGVNPVPIISASATFGVINTSALYVLPGQPNETHIAASGIAAPGISLYGGGGATSISLSVLSDNIIFSGPSDVGLRLGNTSLINLPGQGFGIMSGSLNMLGNNIIGATSAVSFNVVSSAITTNVATASTFIVPGTPATSGVIRVPNAAGINWRNRTNNGDISLYAASNEDFLIIDGAGIDFSARPIVTPQYIDINPNGLVSATTGAIRIANSQAIAWRNTQNNNNLLLAPNVVNNNLTYVGFDFLTVDNQLLGTTAFIRNLASTAIVTGGLVGTGQASFGAQYRANAIPGMVGEYLEATTGLGSLGIWPVFAATGNYVNLLSLALTAGDWDLTGMASFYCNSAVTTEFALGVSNDPTGVVGDLFSGYNFQDFVFASSATLGNGGFFNISVPSYRVSISASSTFYLKGLTTTQGGFPKASGRLSARRMR